MDSKILDLSQNEFLFNLDTAFQLEIVTKAGKKGCAVIYESAKPIEVGSLLFPYSGIFCRNEPLDANVCFFFLLLSAFSHNHNRMSMRCWLERKSFSSLVQKQAMWFELIIIFLLSFYTHPTLTGKSLKS